MTERKKILSPMDHISGVVQEASKEVLDYSPQLFLKPNNKIEPVEVEPIATSVLIKVSDEHFLLTAGHVLEDVNVEDVGVVIGNTFHVLNGNVKFTDKSRGKQHDKIDIAIWKLDKEVAESLSVKHNFLATIILN